MSNHFNLLCINNASILNDNITKFLNELVKEYRNARTPIKSDPRLFRGESRSVASIAEDLLAKAFIDTYKNIDFILINQTITFATEGKRLRIKPDIIFVQDNIIKIMFDLKMDLGYARDNAIENIKRTSERFNEIKKQTVTYWQTIENLPTRKELTFSDRSKYAYIVVSDRNIALEQYKSIEKYGKGTGFFTFVRGEHPNQYKITIEQILDNLSKALDCDEIKSLNELICQCLTNP